MFDLHFDYGLLSVKFDTFLACSQSLERYSWKKDIAGMLIPHTTEVNEDSIVKFCKVPTVGDGFGFDQQSFI